MCKLTYEGGRVRRLEQSLQQALTHGEEVLELWKLISDRMDR